jgi:hypothetical protein
MYTNPNKHLTSLFCNYNILILNLFEIGKITTFVMIFKLFYSDKKLDVFYIYRNKMYSHILILHHRAMNS